MLVPKGISITFGKFEARLNDEARGD